MARSRAGSVDYNSQGGVASPSDRLSPVNQLEVLLEGSDDSDLEQGQKPIRAPVTNAVGAGHCSHTALLFAARAGMAAGFILGAWSAYQVLKAAMGPDC